MLNYLGKRHAFLSYTSFHERRSLIRKPEIPKMMLSETPGALKNFRRTPWKFQQTFQTPLKNLQRFVATIVSPSHNFTAGCLTIEQVVFEPKHLISLLTDYSISPRYGHDLSLTAVGQEEVEALLQAALSDWVDFIFIPQPKPFVIYADHDEYTTFYAHTCSNLNRVAEALSGQGFKTISGYERQL